MSKILLSYKQVGEKISRRRTWIYLQVKAGKFPPPELEDGKNLWTSETIDRWIDEQIAAAKRRKEQRLAETKPGRRGSQGAHAAPA